LRSYLFAGLAILGLIVAALAIAPFAWNQYLVGVKRQRDYQRQVAKEQTQDSAVLDAAIGALWEQNCDQVAREYLADPEAYLAKIEAERRDGARDFARKTVLERWPKYFHREITEDELNGQVYVDPNYHFRFGEIVPGAVLVHSPIGNFYDY